MCLDNTVSNFIMELSDFAKTDERYDALVVSAKVVKDLPMNVCEYLYNLLISEDLTYEQKCLKVIEICK